ncbi:DUF3954 domain-containing protein [Peribacillus frigoritolerans]|uniref:DUF3954 domain-containing protein n=1 Tax=Peribacillus frigoritolerans TaxID=450367 RepID=UPI0032E4D9C6
MGKLYDAAVLAACEVERITNINRCYQKTGVGAMEVKINLEENMVYVVSNQKLTSMNPPDGGFGETIIMWQNDNAVHATTKFTTRIGENRK